MLPERGNECLTALHGPQAVACAMREFVPDHQHLTSDLPPQGVEKLNQLRTLDRTWKESEVEALESDPSDRRELVPVEVILQDRGVAARCPTANLSRSFAQSRFVDKDDDSPLFSGVFFNSGQRTRFQRRIPASSRSSARPVGRWLLNPSDIRIRHTWLSLYRRANFSSIIWPTRRNVHNSVAKPCASAPSLAAVPDRLAVVRPDPMDDREVDAVALRVHPPSLAGSNRSQSYESPQPCAQPPSGPYRATAATQAGPGHRRSIERRRNAPQCLALNANERLSATMKPTTW